MTNTVLNTNGYAYDPFFYATNAILPLYQTLVMARSVYRGYDRDVKSQGQFIDIRKPDTFTAQDAPSTAQGVDPDHIQIQLNRWKEVKFSLTDKELSLSAPQLINDHIEPMGRALARVVDNDLMSLYADVPWYQDLSSPAVEADITATRAVLAQNNVPVDDRPNMNMVINPSTEAAFLNRTGFTQNQGSGQVGIDAQVTGLLGPRYGFNIAMSQNIATHTAGSASVTALKANGAATAGATTLNINATSVTGTLVKGDILSFAGHSQKYVVTATFTASSNAFANVSISPALQANVADQEAITFAQKTGAQNLAFHKNAFALAVAPLSTMGAEVGGARMSTSSLEGITIRSRIYYVGATSSLEVALDILYGYKTLDANKAVRMRA